jgi:hypothetical protein
MYMMAQLMRRYVQETYNRFTGDTLIERDATRRMQKSSMSQKFVNPWVQHIHRSGS